MRVLQSLPGAACRGLQEVLRCTEYDWQKSTPNVRGLHLAAQADGGCLYDAH